MKKRLVDWTNASGDIVTAWLYDDIPLVGSDVCDHLHIEDLEPQYGKQERGRYLLIIGTDEYQSDDLAQLECILREWSRSSGENHELPDDMADCYQCPKDPNVTMMVGPRRLDPDGAGVLCGDFDHRPSTDRSTT